MRIKFQKCFPSVAIITCCICITPNALAQVTIGSQIDTNKGSLLDLKQEDKTDGSANSTKGFGLPRVALTDINKLEPCVTTNDSNIKSHTGLTVFNTTDNSSTDATLSEGVYTWNGKKWVSLTTSTVGADNGLTVTNNNLELGGTLSKSTNIAQTDKDLTFSSTNTSQSSADFGTSNAALSLTANNKGFMPPRIALTGGSDASTIPLTTDDQGMVVYNIGTAIEQGLYTWSGSSWQQLITKVPKESNVSLYYQTKNSQLGSANGVSHDSMIEIPFSAQGQTDDPVPLIIPESGSYAVQVKLYSKITFPSGTITQGNYILYVGVWINGTLKDISEIFVPILNNTNSVTNVMLGFKADAGDEFVIKGGIYDSANGGPNITGISKGDVWPTPYSIRTSMIYMKL